MHNEIVHIYDIKKKVWRLFLKRTAVWQLQSFIDGLPYVACRDKVRDNTTLRGIKLSKKKQQVFFFILLSMYAFIYSYRSFPLGDRIIYIPLCSAMLRPCYVLPTDDNRHNNSASELNMAPWPRPLRLSNRVAIKKKIAKIIQKRFHPTNRQISRNLRHV